MIFVEDSGREFRAEVTDDVGNGVEGSIFSDLFLIINIINADMIIIAIRISKAIAPSIANTRHDIFFFGCWDGMSLIFGGGGVLSLFFGYTGGTVSGERDESVFWGGGAKERL